MWPIVHSIWTMGRKLSKWSVTDSEKTLLWSSEQLTPNPLVIQDNSAHFLPTSLSSSFSSPPPQRYWYTHPPPRPPFTIPPHCWMDIRTPHTLKWSNEDNFKRMNLQCIYIFWFLPGKVLLVIHLRSSFHELWIGLSLNFLNDIVFKIS